jgi:hypothetical protein
MVRKATIFLTVMVLSIPALASGFSIGLTALSNPLGQNLVGVFDLDYQADLGSVAHFGIDTSTTVGANSLLATLYPHLYLGGQLVNSEALTIDGHLEVGVPVTLGDETSSFLTGELGLDASLEIVEGLSLIFGGQGNAIILPELSYSVGAYGGFDATVPLVDGLNLSTGAVARFGFLPTASTTADGYARLWTNYKPLKLYLGGDFDILPSFTATALAGLDLEFNPGANLVGEVQYDGELSGSLGLEFKF